MPKIAYVAAGGRSAATYKDFVETFDLDFRAASWSAVSDAFGPTTRGKAIATGHHVTV